jgi:hypothetical protein
VSSPIDDVTASFAGPTSAARACGPSDAVTVTSGGAESTRGSSSETRARATSAIAAATAAAEASATGQRQPRRRPDARSEIASSIFDQIRARATSSR